MSRFAHATRQLKRSIDGTMIGRSIPALMRAVAVALAVLGAIPAAQAHPHVFIQVKTQLIAKDGQLVGLRHRWRFDETWLNNQLMEHDKDGDGKLTRAELAPLEAESRQTLEMFRSFTVLRSQGALIRVTNPSDVVVDYLGDVLALSFSVTLAKPIPLAGAEILLETYDATFFSGFSFEGADAVVLTGDAAAGCAVKVDAAASPQQMNAFRMIQRQLGPEFTYQGTPRSAAISCAKPKAVERQAPAAVLQPVSTR